MSNIFIDSSIKEFLPYISDFSKTSLDDSNSVSLIIDTQNDVINFDGYVQNEYGHNYKTNDTLFWEDNALQEMKFVEFKNGKWSPTELRIKCYDSVMVLSDLLNKDLNYISQHLSYVLVCNDPISSIQDSIAVRANSEVITKTTNLRNNFSILVGKIFKSVEVESAISFTSKYL
ncbi:hypothetical protein [Leuconostoc lactis]|uniref:hypothetical protein n=1 Tax=Leuconostoc lactis TaxID=1246 RepID=UPI00020DA309|nr:hypothetical protein [Leuconostoc lactis]